jgi:hypothetical protein
MILTKHIIGNYINLLDLTANVIVQWLALILRVQKVPTQRLPVWTENVYASY